jgi:hypothetical protein
MRRTSVTLTEAQERAIHEFAQPGPYRDELAAWARSQDIELGESFSEATLVRLLIDAGIEHIRTRSFEVAYTELAGVYVDEDLSHEITALRSEALAAEHERAQGLAGADAVGGPTGSSGSAAGAGPTARAGSGAQAGSRSRTGSAGRAGSAGRPKGRPPGAAGGAGVGR